MPYDILVADLEVPQLFLMDQYPRYCEHKQLDPLVKDRSVELLMTIKSLIVILLISIYFSNLQLPFRAGWSFPNNNLTAALLTSGNPKVGRYAW